MARGGAVRMKMAICVLMCVGAHDCIEAEEPYIGAHRAGFGRFLQVLRDEMPMYDDRVKMVRAVCVSGSDGRWLIVAIANFLLA
jgi:hypothetical protein